MPPAPLVTYIRVSTSGQGRSGLGFEAQRLALAHLAATASVANILEWGFRRSKPNSATPRDFAGAPSNSVVFPRLRVVERPPRAGVDHMDQVDDVTDIQITHLTEPSRKASAQHHSTKNLLR